MILASRLFWKILLGFWLAIVIVSQLLWVGFRLHEGEPPEARLARRIAGERLTAAAAVLAAGGEKALSELALTWPEGERPTLLPVGHPGPEPDALQQTVALPDGRSARLSYPLAGLHERIKKPDRVLFWLNVPTPMIWIGGLGGLLFSALLAWHLTRLIGMLRGALAQVAKGDLTVRLLPRLGRRRDELSDLGRDFDAMVARLHQLVSGREQLLHDVSHELRSPLARVQLALGLAEQSPDKVPASLARIQQEMARMDRLIGELLTLARSEQGEALETDYFDLYGLVAAVVADARFEGERHGIGVTLEGACEQTLQGNAELLRRALENVVRNALRFTPAGASVAVSLGCEGDLAWIRVADCGPGIEEAKLSSAFDPFVRIGAQGAGKGYGLGLAIARKAVLTLGGQIRAANRPAGGLLVSITLPCSPVSETAP